MRLTEDVYLVGSGQKGLSHRCDCEVYAVDAGEEIVLLDAGAGLAPEVIVANLRADGLEPERISTVLLTHEHGDHAGGAAAFHEQFGATVCCHAAAKPMVEHGDDRELGLDIARAEGVYPEDYVYQHVTVQRALEDGETVEVGRLTFRTIYTPGHSAGSASYLLDVPGGRALFSGDLVFWGGQVLLLNYWGCDPGACRESLRKLARLGVDLLLPGHHQFTLRDGQQHIDRAAAALAGLYFPPGPPRAR